jgi:hypothetical protein
MRAARILLITLFGFLTIEAILFRSGIYSIFLNPQSAAGVLETILRNEEVRKVQDRRQVLTIGDSRMGFLPRYANQIERSLGYTFATVAMGGTTTRCWPYMLRDVDPTARRYAAIIIPVEDYNDPEQWESLANRPIDVNFLIARLRWNDLVEFAGSHETWDVRWKVALGMILKGSALKRDFQDFLHGPRERVFAALQSRRESHGWFYDYVGTKDDLTAYQMDWVNKKVIGPADAPEGMKSFLRTKFLDPRPPERGKFEAYQKHWLGKIYEHYRGSGTKLIIVRLPRGPFVRPDQSPYNPHSAVRELAKMPEVILDDEHDFDFLEKPEYFWEPPHLNGLGSREFSLRLARRVRELLGTADAL